MKFLKSTPSAPATFHSLLFWFCTSKPSTYPSAILTHQSFFYCPKKVPASSLFAG